MKIYLASGYSVMNLKGREKSMRDLFSPYYRRLVSYIDYERGNDILATMGVIRI
jgi:hypothetical protein